MRVVIAIAFLVVTTSYASAQQQALAPGAANQAMKLQLGELIFNNTLLVVEVRRLTEENEKLKAAAAAEAAKKD